MNSGDLGARCSCATFGGYDSLCVTHGTQVQARARATASPHRAATCAATSDALHVLLITPSADLPSAMRRYEHARDHASEVTALGWDLIAADLRMHRDTAGLPDYAEVRAEACDARAAALRAQEQQPPRTPTPSPSDPAPAWFALVTRPDRKSVV